MCYTVETDKTKPLRKLSPHYLHDPAFREAQTIFGAEEDGIGYDYSDRLWQWNREKREAAGKAATESGHTPKTAAWFEAMLSAYFDKPVELVHMLSGFNLSNGYPYHVYGYRFTEAAQ